MAIVSYVVGDCVGCGGKDTFGNVDVYRTYVLRGCKRCRHRQRIPLPTLRKKVLYLDQFFFSKAFRAGNPQFVEAARLIEKLSSLQLLVVPYSTIHEDETHQWEKHDDLFRFIKRTAGGDTFVPAYDVERSQLINAFRAWLAGAPASYQLDRQEALREDTHTWNSYFWVDAGKYLGDVGQLRDLKRQAAERMFDLVNEGRHSQRGCWANTRLQGRHTWTPTMGT